MENLTRITGAEAILPASLKENTAAYAVQSYLKELPIIEYVNE